MKYLVFLLLLAACAPHETTTAAKAAARPLVPASFPIPIAVPTPPSTGGGALAPDELPPTAMSSDLSSEIVDFFGTIHEIVELCATDAKVAPKGRAKGEGR